MKCQFCKDKRQADNRAWDLKIEDHLIVTKDIKNHFHIHGPVDNKGLMQQFVNQICTEAGISDGHVSQPDSNFCYYCQPPMQIGDGDKQILEHLVVTRDAHNHVHVHGPLHMKETMEQMVDAICSQADLKNPLILTGDKKVSADSNKKVPDAVVFKNRQAIGDILTMTAGVRDFKEAYPDTRVGVITTAMHIWDNNPHIDHTFKDEEKILNVGPGFLTNRSNRSNLHMCNAFRVDIENKLEIQIPQGPIRPDIWMTEEEYNAPPLIEGPYWILVVGGEPGWPVKMYPQERWQEIINSLPEIQFVQIGVSNHPWPHLENVIDYIGKTEDRETGIRKLFNLFLHAQGSLGLVSMHMHLSAAFNNPCVVVAGAREPMWFTHYLGHQYIQTNGCLPCAETSACWKCKFEGCTDVQKRHGMEPQDKIPPCIDLIKPYEVIDSVKKYYDGGRLKYGEKVKNSFFSNIVKEAKTFPLPKIQLIDTTLPKQFELEWGGGSITDRDWAFIKNVVEEYEVKTVLEFGAGLSTLLLTDIVEHMVTYETADGWIERIKKQSADNVDIRKWDGKTIKEPLAQFDLAFVDGPAGGANREFSTKIGSEHAKIVIVHDASRTHEKNWQEKYLKDKFKFASKGGHRCHLWVHPDLEAKKIPTPITVTAERKEQLENPPSDLNVVSACDLQKPDVTLVSTARGWGGCARSITTIMKFLLERGKSVCFVPFHGTTRMSKEFAEMLRTDLKDVKIGDYDAISKPTGVLFVYADDFIWEFTKVHVQDAFINLAAERKIMMLNYRRGKVGELTWTRNWDNYAFLNTAQEAELLSVHPEAQGKTKVLPPCTELGEFLKAQPKYDGLLKLIRHSSQGDNKFAKTFVDEVNGIKTVRKDVQFHLMPGPTFLEADGEFVIKYQRNNPPVPKFLELGNCFWYSLPEGYMDMGPRVILEAMAAGLPIVADNWGGAKDRVTTECGWLCDTKAQHIEVIKGLSARELEAKGKAARQRAIDHFIPERWIDFILGE